MNNNLTKNLILIVFLVIALLFAVKADASSNSRLSYFSVYPYQEASDIDYYDYYYPDQYSYNSYNSNYNSNYNPNYNSNVPVYGAGYSQYASNSVNQVPSVVNNYYYQNTSQKENVETVAKNTTTTSTKVTNESNTKVSEKSNSKNIEEVDRDNLQTVCSSGDSSCNSRITASAGRPNDGFMPNSIWEWMLVIILILIIVIISRLIVRKKKKLNQINYQPEPEMARAY